jgi:hypothetical protein
MSEKPKYNGNFVFNVPVRIVWTDTLFETSVYTDPVTKQPGKPTYSCLIMIDPANPAFAEMKKVALGVANVCFPGRDVVAQFQTSPKGFKFPWYAGDADNAKRVQTAKDPYEWQKGQVLMRAHSGEKYPPGLGFFDGARKIEVKDPAAKALHKGKFFSGTKALVAVNFGPYGKADEVAGITAYLQSVLSLNTGDPIGGGRKSIEDTFSGYVGHSTGENPLTGAEAF